MTVSSTLHLVPHPISPLYRLEGPFPQKIDEVFGATNVKGIWYFPAFRPAHDRVVEDLFKVVRGLRLTPEVQTHLQDHIVEKDLPEGFTFVTEPFAHQREALVWAYNRPRAGLFLAPGLGKCKITVDLHRLTGNRMLILCPKVVLATWKREFARHGNVDDVIVVAGSKKAKHEALAAAKARMPAAVVITYESATLLAEKVLELSYDAIVLDESHRIKSVASARTKAALVLADKAKRRLLLSGTPSLGSPFGLYPQLRLLGRFFMPENWTEFQKKFGIYDPAQLASGKLQQVQGYRNVSTVQKRVTSVCIRKYLEDCIDLPKRQIIDVPFELEDAQADFYDDLLVGAADSWGMKVELSLIQGKLNVGSGKEIEHPYVWAPEAVARLNKLEQVTSGFVNQTDANPGLCNGCPNLDRCIEDRIRPYTNKCLVAPKAAKTTALRLKNARLAAFSDILDDILEDPANKVIVWTKYLPELDDIEKHVKDRGDVEYVRVQGGMPLPAFEQAMETFNTDPNCRLYIGQVASGIGVTLNAANYMIYYSLPWSLEHYDQSMARNYRIGQDRPVIVYRLLAEGTIDRDKAAALDQKVDIDALLTSAEEREPCPKHDRRLSPDLFPDGLVPCTCSDSVHRIIAKLETLSPRREVEERITRRRLALGLPELERPGSGYSSLTDLVPSSDVDESFEEW